MILIIDLNIFNFYDFSYPKNLRMKQLNDLFSVPEICLLSNITEYFERKHIAYNPEILFYDTQVLLFSLKKILFSLL